MSIKVKGKVIWCNSAESGETSNTIVTGMNKAISRLLAGDMSYTPTHVGFLLGDSPVAGLVPDSEDTLSKVISDIVTKVSPNESNYNIYLFPVFSQTPSVDGSTVTFTSVTSNEWDYTLLPGGREGAIPNTLQHLGAVLLISRDSYKGTSTLLAWNTPVSATKNPGRELSIYWPITIGDD